MNLTDTHCHLQFDKLSADLDGVLGRARKAGVSRLICVGTSLKDSRQAAEIAHRHENVWAAAGAHPHEASKFQEDFLEKEFAGLLSQPKVVAAGEIGLDFYKDYAPRVDQEKALRAQIEAALPSGLPFIFHVRDAWTDFWRIFDEYDGLQGVVHSFSSGVKQLNAALERGLYVGLNGIMTFTKDEAQLEAAKLVPLGRLLLETDAPFLTPEPYRGQICEPKHTAATADFLAGLRGGSVEELSRATTDNAVKVFKLE